MKIHSDHNGVTTSAILESNGADVKGHLYQIEVGSHLTWLTFQLGPVKEAGANGITNEALLAVLIHRTKYLDNKFSCDENKRAIQHMEEALVNLEVRTARRMVRGVEGLNKA